MEELYERLYVRLEEINKKADTIIMNQGRTDLFFEMKRDFKNL